MIVVHATDVFTDWLRNLRDPIARSRIIRRIDRLKDGNFGDSKSVGDGVSELRVDHGPGYRVYFVRKGPVVVVLLCGGDKSTQSSDIVAAKKLAAEEGSSWA